jgi:hypothetical protein
MLSDADFAWYRSRMGVYAASMLPVKRGISNNGLMGRLPSSLSLVFAGRGEFNVCFPQVFTRGY